MNFHRKYFIRINEDVDVPLIGCIAFGVIDRGTNVVELRSNTYCPLNCIFCSTDAGPYSCHRQSEYRVNRELLVSYAKEMVKLKGKDVEFHLDSVGEPLAYNELPELIHDLKSIDGVKVVSLQTHGALLSYKLAEKLAAEGLDRINLSIDTTDPERAKFLQGMPWYDVRKVMEVTEWIVKNTNIDVLLAPLLLPGVNEKDIEDVIEWGKKIGVGKRFPGYGIQLFLRHKHGRNPKNLKKMNFAEFEELLRYWEKKHGVKLIYSDEDFGIHKAPSLPILFEKNEKVRVKIVAPGWLKNEWLAVPLGRFEGSRVITVIAEKLDIGVKIPVRIIENKHNIYLARPVWQ